MRSRHGCGNDFGPRQCGPHQSVRRRAGTDYIRFMQGGIIDNGYLYSAEGFSVKEKRENLPAIRVFDLKNHRQVMHVNLFDELGLKVEPECIDFDGDKLVYSDYEGNVYQVTFE